MAVADKSMHNPSRHVLIGAPTYDGKRWNSLSMLRLFRHPPPDTLVNIIETGGSVLTYGFNSLWTKALTLKDPKQCPVPVTHFLLWHADIVPVSDSWLAILLDEMERVDADVLSAVVPIKNVQGMTSTARDDDPWNPTRYSTTEIKAKQEATWTEEDLLINTGLMLVNMRNPKFEDIIFTMEDRIIKQPDGEFKAYFSPEDWNFSRQCRAAGIPVWATKAVTLRHMGTVGYQSDDVWGYPTDAAYRASEGKPARPTTF